MSRSPVLSHDFFSRPIAGTFDQANQEVNVTDASRSQTPDHQQHRREKLSCSPISSHDFFSRPIVEESDQANQEVDVTDMSRSQILDRQQHQREISCSTVSFHDCFSCLIAGEHDPANQGMNVSDASRSQVLDHQQHQREMNRSPISSPRLIAGEHDQANQDVNISDMSHSQVLDHQQHQQEISRSPFPFHNLFPPLIAEEHDQVNQEMTVSDMSPILDHQQPEMSYSPSLPHDCLSRPVAGEYDQANQEPNVSETSRLQRRPRICNQEFIGRFPLPTRVYHESFEEWRMLRLPSRQWPIVRGEDLVSQSFQFPCTLNGFFFKVAGWKSEEWSVSLVISMAPLDPLASPYNMLELYLVVERLFEPTPGLGPAVEASMKLSLINGETAKHDAVKATTQTFSRKFTNAESVHIERLSFEYWTYLFRFFSTLNEQTVSLVLDIYSTASGVFQIQPRQVLENRDIMDTIMENLDARSLASLNEALQPTPSKWISSYDGFRITLQRVIRVLTRFFPDPHAFADCMCETGAIIGGSTALCIFNGEPWLPGDLDVVVSPTFAPRLMEFVGSNGYVQEDKKVDPYDPPNGVFTSRPFSWFCYRKGGRKIDISTTRKGTPADFIGTYHHSYVMNFICHDGLYSFFPEDTSARRGRVNSYEKEHKAAAAREKYRERGYDVIDDLPIQTFTGDYGHILIHKIKNFWLQKLPLTTSDYRKFCQERSARDKAFQKQRT